MEEPPKVERLLSSRGISLSNAASILKSYVSIIDQHHGPVDPSSSSSANNVRQNDTLKSQQDDIAAEEKEEERLLARLNQLDPAINNNNRLLGGSISEDVYERLRMIMESVVAESEGRVVSAVGVYAKSKKAAADNGNNNNEEGGEGVMMEGEMENNGQDEFMKELEEAERLETEYNQEVEQEQPKIEEEEPQQQQKIDYEQKKKDKKAKKAAKKAKKEAKKRKASSGGDNEEKRVKVEEDQ